MRRRRPFFRKEFGGAKSESGGLLCRATIRQGIFAKILRATALLNKVRRRRQGAGLPRHPCPAGPAITLVLPKASARTWLRCSARIWRIRDRSAENWQASHDAFAADGHHHSANSTKAPATVVSSTSPMSTHPRKARAAAMSPLRWRSKSRTCWRENPRTRGGPIAGGRVSTR